MTTADLIWTQPTWLETAQRWLQTELTRQGIAITRPVEQPHIRPWSTVLRVPTNRGDLYFKAVTPLLAHEAALTQYLAAGGYTCIPLVVAAETEQGWLVTPDGGIRLREVLQQDGDIGRWEALLPLYARLQIEVADQVADLLALGVPDRRLSGLPDHFEALLAQQELLGLDQPWGLTTVEFRQLQTFSEPLADLCEQLAAYRLPPSLDHGDFHDGNIFVNGSDYTFFDWGDSSITHPFFSLRTTFVSLENTLSLDQASPKFERLRDRYLEPWTVYEPIERLIAALELSQRLAPIIAALRWYAAISSLGEVDRSDYAEAIPSLLRELLTVNGEF